MTWARRKYKKNLKPFSTRQRRLDSSVSGWCRWMEKVSKRNDGSLGDIASWKTSCYLGFAMMEDPLCDGAVEHVQELVKMGMKIIILTGDASSVTEHIVTNKFGWQVEKWKEQGKKDKDDEAEGEKEKKKPKKKTEEKEEKKEQEVKLFSVLSMTADSLDADGKENVGIDTRLAGYDGLLVCEIFPEHKYAVEVKGLQQAGHVVGMVGDGVNDASAMRISDLAFAAKDSTQVANTVADFILVGRDLAGIIKTD